MKPYANALRPCGALAVALLLAFARPAALRAEPLPSYATADEQIKGRIASVDGKYRLSLRDERGYVDNVRLHDGTVIEPTGLTLSPGQSVTIFGHADGAAFVANEILTPYAYGAGRAYPAAVAYPYGYPYYGGAAYPYYGGYPYPYSGPSFGIVIGGYYGHGYYGHGYYGHGYYGRGYYGHGYYGRGYYGHGYYGRGYYGGGYYGRGSYGGGYEARRYPAGATRATTHFARR